MLHDSVLNRSTIDTDIVDVDMPLAPSCFWLQCYTSFLCLTGKLTGGSTTTELSSSETETVFPGTRRGKTRKDVGDIIITVTIAYHRVNVCGASFSSWL